MRQAGYQVRLVFSLRRIAVWKLGERAFSAGVARGYYVASHREVAAASSPRRLPEETTSKQARFRQTPRPSDVGSDAGDVSSDNG